MNLNKRHLEARIISFGDTPVSRGRADEGEKHHSVEQYFAVAIHDALGRVGLSKKDIDGQGLGVCGTVGSHGDNGERWSLEVVQTLSVRPKVLLRSDHGGTASLVLLLEAAKAVDAGYVDFMVVVGGGVYGQPGAKALDSTSYIRDFETPFGMMGPNSLFGLILSRYNHQYGLSSEQLAKIPLVQRFHASLNKNAYLRKPLKLEDYLASRFISDPLRVLDCCIQVSGAASFIVASKEFARQHGLSKSARIIGHGQCANFSEGNPLMPDITVTGMKTASREAFSEARCKPKDMSFAQIYDDYSIAALMQMEDLGYCNKGEGGKFLDTHDLTFSGDIPLNTGGGMLSAGQTGQGFVHLIEALRQMRGEASGRQISSVEKGVVTGMGGESYGGNLIHHVCVVLESD